MFQAIKAAIPASMKARVRNLAPATAFARRSYGQEGEDVLLARLFNDGQPGIYVDIGAHHPFRFSNTYLFYQRGWRGMNVDAMPGSMKMFQRFRNRDVNIEAGVGTSAADLEFHMFEEPALNTFDPNLARDRRNAGLKYLGAKIVPCKTMAQIVKSSGLDVKVKNSFLSVDVEGLDLDVLRSNDWSYFRPKVVVVEVLGSSISDIPSSEVATFLAGHGYIAYSKLGASVFFKSNAAEMP